MTRSGATTTVFTTTMVAATTVVGGYGGRARFARAEADIVSRPRLLRGLLRTAGHVAELPCGAGHFLAEYAAAGAETTMPNAALNQLACQTPPAELLAVIRRALWCGVELLAQVVCVHPGDRADTAGFYDPVREHGVWFADRYLDPVRAGGAVLRRRCQHRHHTDGVGRLRIEFDYLASDGASLHTSEVELSLFSAEELAAVLTAAGFRHIRFLPGHGGLSEILAQTDDGDRR